MNIFILSWLYEFEKSIIEVRNVIFSMMHPNISRHLNTKYIIFIDINFHFWNIFLLRHINASIDIIYHNLQEIVVYRGTCGENGRNFWDVTLCQRLSYHHYHHLQQGIQIFTRKLSLIIAKTKKWYLQLTLELTLYL